MKYFNVEMFEPLFKILEKCKDVQQDVEHHPEGDVLTHSLQCFLHALKETDDFDIILAALFHDIGKMIENNGHEQHSAELCENYLTPKAIWLIEQHMRGRLFVNGTMTQYTKVQQLASHPWFPDLIWLIRIDKLGRKPNRKVIFDREKIIKLLNIKIDDRFRRNQERSEENVNIQM
jgi:exopolyphosphatase/pppGpp-phosphohydrolase